jgi:membrane-bound metal-dependent hydrolase YbcI (DUF457 family)
VGAGTALARSLEQDGLAILAETAGGALGGWLGGALPDVLEPATSPRHRALCHSWAAATTILTWANARVADAQQYCRDQAQHWERRAASADGLGALFATLAALLCHFAAGFFAGLRGGYVSHLVLDAVTPAGLPLRGRFVSRRLARSSVTANS